MLKMMFLDMHVSFLVQNDRGRSDLLHCSLCCGLLILLANLYQYSLHIQFNETSFLHIHTVFQLFLHCTALFLQSYKEHLRDSGSLLNRDIVAVKTRGSCRQFTDLANFLGLFMYDNPERRSDCDIYIG